MFPTLWELLQWLRLGLSYRILMGGAFDAGKPFYDLYVPASDDDGGIATVVTDREGRAYAATRLRVQIFDHNGHVTGILPPPGNQAADSLAFRGDDLDTLHVSSGGMVYAPGQHGATDSPGC